jgi:hypothetical protein
MYFVDDKAGGHKTVSYVRLVASLRGRSELLLPPIWFYLSVFSSA